MILNNATGEPLVGEGRRDSDLSMSDGPDARFERAKRIEEFKVAWYKRNPVHEYNADTGENMFWGTAMMVMEDFFNQNTEIGQS